MKGEVARGEIWTQSIKVDNIPLSTPPSLPTFLPNNVIICNNMICHRYSVSEIIQEKKKTYIFPSQKTKNFHLKSFFPGDARLQPGFHSSIGSRIFSSDKPLMKAALKFLHLNFFTEVQGIFPPD